MKHVILLFLFWGGQHLILLGQSPDIIWEKYFGSSRNEEPSAIINTSDGNLLIIGYTRAENRNDLDVLLLKVTIDGEMIWEKTFGDTKIEFGKSVVELKDSSIILLCETDLGNNKNIWLIKLNSNGDILWDKQIGTSLDEYPSNVILNEDKKSLTIIGTQYDIHSSNPKVFVTKINLLGEEIWTKYYSSPINEVNELGGRGEGANDIIQTKDGGFVFVGYTMTKAKRGLATDGWICKINNNGKKMWSQSVGAIGGDNLLDVFEDAKGNVLITGEYYDKPQGLRSLWLLKFDYEGKQLFEKHYHEGNICTSTRGIVYNSKSILIVGVTDNDEKSWIRPDTISENEKEELINNGWTTIQYKGREYLEDDYSKTKHKKIDEDVFIIQVNLDGDLIWKKIIGGDDDDKATNICKTKEGLIFVVGHTRSYGKGLKDIFLMRIN